MLQRLELILDGRVQGVGFRPFVYQLAMRLHLSGWVRNEKGSVRIQVEGDAQQLQHFRQQLIDQAPATSLPQLQSEQPVAPLYQASFEILASDAQASASIHVPPDYYLCPDCQAELNNPHDRRYGYPFINCTACGPRYTLIERLPYDRINTCMNAFPLCTDCETEYRDPESRRFHAEPIACPTCGPQLEYEDNDQQLTGARALDACVTALQQGEIVIIKGIGGYHLCCDATRPDTIARLRARKQRPDKPFAVMFPPRGKDELDAVREALVIDNSAAQTLASPSRPILLLPRRPDGTLPESLAPGLNEIGAMLPYSPLHVLLLSRLGKPIVATSANLGGEPVLTDADEVRGRLARISTYYLHHNRPIVRPADDPVMRMIAGRPRPFRLGRGTAPLELTLPAALPHPVLACGGQMKNTIALAWDNRVVISPHIGELESLRSRQVFTTVIDDLQQLYEVKAESIVCDNHPDYFSSRWARQQSLPVTAINHHHAHASVVAGEFPAEKNWLVFTWDGTGLFEGHALWGGEALYGQPGQWHRVASWRRFRLPGGDRVAREPWRSAQSLCWHTDIHRDSPVPANKSELLFEAWQKNINAPLTSSVGRLFDAAASLIDLCHSASFEGQAPMMLEQLATQGTHSGIELPLLDDSGLLISDWQPLLPLLLDTRLPPADRAAAFHASLADALLAQARALRQQHGDFAIGLSGGVFQNRYLCERVIALATADNFRIYLPEQLPVNDAGLSYGQVIEQLGLFHQQ